MADRTKDIWNDSPEEEQKKPKGQGLKRFLTFLLILIAVLAVVHPHTKVLSGTNRREEP